MKKISGILLIVISVIMLYIGFAYKMVPPALTGIGFIIISIVFFKEKKN